MSFRFQAIGFASLGAGIIRKERDIDDTQFNATHEARGVLLTAVSVEELFRLAVDNFEEWENEMLQQSQNLLIWNSASHVETMANRLTIDRRLANILTAFRLYLDQTDHSISRLFGNPSQQLSDVKTFKSKLYENNLGYRFTEALRNYIQHCGLGVHIIEQGWNNEHGNKGPHSSFYVSPHFNPSMLQSGEFKSAILNEIKALNKTIDLREPIREYVSCLSDLHVFIRETIRLKVESARSLYDRSYKELSTTDGISLNSVILYKLRASGEVEDEVALVTEFLKVYAELYQKNTMVRNLRRKFVSNVAEN